MQLWATPTDPAHLPHRQRDDALALGYYAAELFFIVLCICVSILTAVTFGFGGLLSCLFFVVLIPRIYYAYLAYSKPAEFEIPVVTKFMKQQGWLK